MAPTPKIIEKQTKNYIFNMFFRTSRRLQARHHFCEKLLGAASGRFAMACPDHVTPEQRSLQLCRDCFNKDMSCEHCGGKTNVVPSLHHCTQSDCNAKFRLCSKCCVLTSAKQRLLCKKCWHNNGDICAYCNVQWARSKIRFLRSCKSCKNRCFALLVGSHTQTCQTLSDA